MTSRFILQILLRSAANPNVETEVLERLSRQPKRTSSTTSDVRSKIFKPGAILRRSRESQEFLKPSQASSVRQGENNNRPVRVSSGISTQSTYRQIAAQKRINLRISLSKDLTSTDQDEDCRLKSDSNTVDSTHVHSICQTPPNATEPAMIGSIAVTDRDRSDRNGKAVQAEQIKVPSNGTSMRDMTPGDLLDAVMYKSQSYIHPLAANLGLEISNTSDTSIDQPSQILQHSSGLDNANLVKEAPKNGSLHERDSVPVTNKFLGVKSSESRKMDLLELADRSLSDLCLTSECHHEESPNPDQKSEQLSHNSKKAAQDAKRDQSRFEQSSDVLITGSNVKNARLGVGPPENLRPYTLQSRQETEEVEIAAVSLELKVATSTQERQNNVIYQNGTEDVGSDMQQSPKSPLKRNKLLLLKQRRNVIGSPKVLDSLLLGIWVHSSLKSYVPQSCKTQAYLAGDQLAWQCVDMLQAWKKCYYYI